MFAKRRHARFVILAIFCFLVSAAHVYGYGGARLADGTNLNNGPVTTITVDSGTDPDNSKSTTCLSAAPCTLRRAIVQARALPPEERPVLIAFDIPATAVEGYDSTLQVWKLAVQSMSDPAVFRALEGGQITIDGTTQPGGRADGPKIILIGPSTGNKDGLLVGVNASGSHDNNVVRGLSFQNFKTHLIVNSDDNVIEDNWFGLTADGTGVYLRADNPEDGSGSAGIALSAGVAGNVVQQNVFLGFDGVAAALRGDDTVFANNYVGTTAVGTVPDKATDPDLICTQVDWLGGGGITMEGEGHHIEDNIFAGLRQEIFHASTQPAAIQASGRDHRIENNLIGVDAAAVETGVCGRGIYLVNSPEGLRVADNRLVNPAMSAISLNGVLYDANELRGNVIKQQNAWPQVKGNPAAEDAIQLGTSLPAALLNFAPARVTQIDGRTVSGTHGSASPCPDCVIELFLDDRDNIKEALQPLAAVTAKPDGTWTAKLPAELTKEQGLRTTSTTAKFNTIANISAGTTTGLSVLYVQEPPVEEGPRVYLPVILGD